MTQSWSVALYFVLVLLLLSLSSNSKDSSHLEKNCHDGSRYYSIKLLSPGFIRNKISFRSLTFVKDSGEICNSDSLSDREQRFQSRLTHQNKDPWVVFNQADYSLFKFRSSETETIGFSMRLLSELLCCALDFSTRQRRFNKSWFQSCFSAVWAWFKKNHLVCSWMPGV